MKHVQACLSAREGRESSFHHCGSPVRLVQPVYAREILIKPFQPPKRYCEVPGKIEKALFTTVVFEAGTSLFMCGKVLITPF